MGVNREGLSQSVLFTLKESQNYDNSQCYWYAPIVGTSSSFSGVTFSHYKAVASHTILSAMHAAYLTLCARSGIPLARWGIGLTVLLEKIVGNNFIHKLRAICLFEADFN
jgi:hypothetical protein